MTEAIIENTVVVSTATRNVMRANKRRDTGPEMKVRRWLHARGYANATGQSVIVSKICDVTGRTVFAQATAPVSGPPGDDVVAAIGEDLARLAKAASAIGPQHWLPSGEHVLFAPLRKRVVRHSGQNCEHLCH